jgi:hypothetical protein
MSKVVVVGGGWSGCAAALAARKAGADVTLVERTDMLLGSGLVGGIFRNNGRFTAAEEMIALGGGDLFEVMDGLARHVNFEFPGHKHSSLYDSAKIAPEVRRLLEGNGIEIMDQTRIFNIEKEGNVIQSVESEEKEKVEGDVFIDCTGTSANTGNCTRYGNGCVMCIYRCPTFKTRVSISEKAGVKPLVGRRADGTPGVFSGACKIMKHTLAPEVVSELDKTGVYVAPLTKDLIDESKLSKKACVQYALPEYAENLIFLDTGFAKLMTTFYPLNVLRKLPGFENARYEDPYAGGLGNSIRYMAMAPRDNTLKVKGIENLYCAGEQSGPIVGHTEGIVTGCLAGYNSVRHISGEETLTFPESIAVGDFISFATEQMETEEGLKKRCTFSGGHYFERMKKLKLYTTDVGEIRRRVEKEDLTSVLNKS